MKSLVIVGCGATKQEVPSAARHLYTGPLFTAALKYARSISNDAGIRVLSAKYGLVNLDAILTPYDVTWGRAGCISRDDLAAQLPVSWKCNQFILLCGHPYRAALGEAYRHRFHSEISAAAPMEHLGIGKQLQWLKENTV